MAKIIETTANTILRVNAHVDGGWFWSKYSASPYLGCHYGCSYCFLRQNRYGLVEGVSQNVRDPFTETIRVVTNAPELLDRELCTVPNDVIIVGDYQSIESRYQLSRRMLEACHAHQFPVLVISKSPLVLRDSDVLLKIGKASWSCVALSIACSEAHRRSFEPNASSIESRFRAMKKLSEKGIYTGTALMPILPYITDNDENLKEIVQRTRENGGKFVLAGGLVLSDDQRDHFLTALRNFDATLVDKYQTLYKGKYSPQDNSWARIGRKVKALCEEYSLAYRIKRYIPKSPSSINKIIAEELFLKVYELELEEADPATTTKLRELAWRIDELPLPREVAMTTQ